MSRRLVDTLWTADSYLHSPVDDLESFYHTAQWAAAFNDGASGGKSDGSKIQRFREMISGDRRSAALDRVLLDSYETWEEGEEEYGSFLTHSTTLLCPWLGKLNTLNTAWSSLKVRAGRLDGTKKKEYLAYNFLVYGYRGVGEYFELIREHRAFLEEAV
jgi:hypothetical protein